MRDVKRLISVLIVLFLALGSVWAGGQKEAKRVLPPGPAFSSFAFMEDEGTVKPIAKKSDKPLKIAVLGLENNPFWIPVKEGCYKAAEELKPLNCTVEWIVPPGDAHTSDFFGTAIESAIVQKYDAIATVAGDSGIVPFINKAVDAGIPVATFNVETDTENKRLFFVGADLYKQGQEAAKIMAKELNNK
ncbi:MAG TPA: sugar ABC transporter substrate-binding protein, partial [Spirochaetia bacterium]|nr:sugar ABC transporter substrate-binding protein [Spirochaetia bacterium]